jgi:hypothetical protein
MVISADCAEEGQLDWTELDFETVLRQSPAGKDMSTEAEGIVGIRHQATTGEDIAN